MTCTNKVYRDDTSAQDMSLDGWSRGFAPEQTLSEMRYMGIIITEEQLALHWARVDKGFTECNARKYSEIEEEDF
jgi:hypothetical protein